MCVRNPPLMSKLHLLVASELECAVGGCSLHSKVPSAEGELAVKHSRNVKSNLHDCMSRHNVIGRNFT